MKVGDLVKNLNSESRMTGLVVGWSDQWPDLSHNHDLQKGRRHPVVAWADGRCHMIVRSCAEVIK